MELLFVYNANSGVYNSVMDVAHKLFSPSTYSCSLCNITHSVFTETKEWKLFREQSEIPLRFIYKDEFVKQFTLYKTKLPIVLDCQFNELKTVISSEELSEIKTIKSLIQTILNYTKKAH